MIAAPLLQIIHDHLQLHLEEVHFQQSWAWPNPDAGHVRVRGRQLASRARQTLDLRVRHSPDLMTDAAPAAPGGEAITQVGCWLFDGAEQVAMTDFWVLTLGTLANPPLRCMVLPTPVLLSLLRQAKRPGQLILYFTNQYGCYASPLLPTEPARRREGQWWRGKESVANLLYYVDGWHQLVDEPDGHWF